MPLKPPPIQHPVIDDSGKVNQIWASWFRGIPNPYGQFISLSANTSLTQTYDHVLVDTSGGSVTLTLPRPSMGVVYWIKKASAANTLTVSGGGANIDGGASKSWTTQYEAHVFWSDGNQWWVF